MTDATGAGQPRPPRSPDPLAAQEADMCPNCVTPWKCNGPHVPPRSATPEPRLRGLPGNDADGHPICACSCGCENRRPAHWDRCIECTDHRHPVATQPPNGHEPSGFDAPADSEAKSDD